MKKISLVLFVLSIVQIVSAQNYVWTQKAGFGGGARYSPVGISYGNKGFVGLGVTITGGGSSVNYNHTDWWEYDPITDIWTQKANFTGSGRNGASIFQIDGFIYVGTGWTPSATGTFYKYDPINNSWSQVANFGGFARYDCAYFAVNNKGYLGLGYAPLNNELWEYSPSSNTWMQKANYPGAARQGASGFVVNGMAYISSGGQQFGNYYNDLYQYNPNLNSWIQKSSYPGNGRSTGEAFSIGNYGFVGVGTNEVSIYNDFWRYDPSNDSWSSIPSMSQSRWNAYSFSIGNCAYVGGGASSLFPNAVALSDFWCLCDVTGVEENLTDLFHGSINPNIVKDELLIQFERDINQEAFVQIFNEQGALVYKSQINIKQNELRIPKLNFAQGYYFCEVFDNSQAKIFSGKFLKE